MAEQKKTTVRQTVKSMRAQFKKLIDKNMELPEHLRLDRSVSVNSSILNP